MKDSNSNKQTREAVVLLSSGLDSLVSLAIAKDQGYEIGLAITANYGQRAALKEIEYAKRICEFYQIPHSVIDVREMMAGIQSGLLTGQIPDIASDKLDDFATASETASQVWVPNRNGFLINLAAIYAENAGYEWIITGFNREEAVTFPDNSQEFIDAINRSLQYSTSNHVKATSFTIDMDKPEIVNRAIELHVPMELVWSCYYGDDNMCGTCESCKRLQRAIADHKQLRASVHFQTMIDNGVE